MAGALVLTYACTLDFGRFRYTLSDEPVGGGGGAAECNVPADCPGSDSDCLQRTCIGGGCGTQFAEIVN